MIGILDTPFCLMANFSEWRIHIEQLKLLVGRSNLLVNLRCSGDCSRSCSFVRPESSSQTRIQICCLIDLLESHTIRYAYKLVKTSCYKIELFSYSACIHPWRLPHSGPFRVLSQGGFVD